MCLWVCASVGVTRCSRYSEALKHLHECCSEPQATDLPNQAVACACTNAGLIHAHQQQYSQALHWFTRASECCIQPQRQSCCLNLALALWALDRQQEACDVWMQFRGCKDRLDVKHVKKEVRTCDSVECFSSASHSSQVAKIKPKINTDVRTTTAFDVSMALVVSIGP